MLANANFNVDLILLLVLEVVGFKSAWKRNEEPVPPGKATRDHNVMEVGTVQQREARSSITRLKSSVALCGHQVPAAPGATGGGLFR